MASKPKRSRPLLLLSSGINFFAGFISGAIFLYLHNSSVNADHQNQCDHILASLPRPLRIPASNNNGGTSLREAAPAPVPPMEASSPLPTIEASRLLNVLVENHTTRVAPHQCHHYSVQTFSPRVHEEPLAQDGSSIQG
jgi:hypothetical protein